MGSQQAYNYFNDPRNWAAYDWGPNLRGTASAFKAGMDTMFSGVPRRRFKGRYSLSKCRRTKTTSKSVVKQKSVTAPMSRVIDTKFIDQKFALSGIKSSASYANIIGNIATGTGEGQRVGNDIRIIKYLISLELIHGSTNVDHTFRVIMVRAKTGNSNTIPSISEIINTDQSANYSPLSLRNMLSIEDYEILLDKMIRIDNNYAASHGAKCLNYQVNTCFPVRYSTSTDSSICRNPVFIYILVNAANTTTGASGQLTVRTIYSDI